MSASYISEFDFHVLTNSSLGERLKFFRTHLMKYEKNTDLYTIKAIAERLEVTPQAISAVERGLSKNPSFGLVHKLVKEYNVSMDTLTDDYYEGKVNLFTIGKPEVMDAIEIDLEELGLDELELDELEFVANTSPKKINTGYWDEKKNDFASPPPSIGVLFYQYNDNKHFHIHYKNAISGKFNETELKKLFVRLDLDITLLNKSNVSDKHTISLKQKYLCKNALNTSKSLNTKDMFKLLTEN